MANLWEFESRTGRRQRRGRDFTRQAQSSGLQKMIRDSLISRGLDPDIMGGLAAPPAVTKPIDRDTIREVVPESNVRSTEVALRTKPRPSVVLPPEEDKGGFLKRALGGVADIAGDVVSALPVKEALSILDVLDIPRREVGKPVARALLEPLALAVDAADAISPDGLSALPRVFPTGEQLRGNTAVEVLSFITDPLNFVPFGWAAKSAKASLLGAKLSIKQSKILRKAVPAARKAMAEEAGGRVPRKDVSDLARTWREMVKGIDEMTPEQQLREFGKSGDEAYSRAGFGRLFVGTGDAADTARITRQIKAAGSNRAFVLQQADVVDASAARRLAEEVGGGFLGGRGIETVAEVVEALPIRGRVLSGPQAARRILGKDLPGTRALTKEEIVREHPEIKALRTKVAGEGHNPPPPPPPRLPGEPFPLLPGGQAPSVSDYRAMESGRFLSSRSDDLMRQAAEVIGEFPAIKLFFKAVTGPAALARLSPEIRAGVMYQMYTGKLDAMLAERLVGSSQEFNKIYTLGKDTSKIVKGGKEIAFGDFAEDVLQSVRTGKPGKFTSTVAEREWITSHKGLMNELAEQYKYVSGEDLRLTDPDLWPRFVLRNDGKVFIKGKGKIGVKQSPAKERLFREQEEAIARGTPYATPVETARLYGQALNKMIMDKIAIRVFKEDKIGQPVIRGLEQQIRALRSQVKAARPTTETARLEVEVIRNKVFNLQAEVAARKRSRVPAKQVLGPGFGKQLLEPEAAQTIQDIIGPAVGGKLGKVLRGGEWVSNITRFIVTGMMDVGHFFIQGATLLSTSPENWAKSVGLSLRAIVDPQSYPRWLKNSPEAIDAANYGVGRGRIDVLEITKRSAALGRLPGAGIIKNTLGRIPLGFEAFIEGGQMINFHHLANIQRAAVGKKATGVLPTTVRAAAGVSKADVEGELYRIAGYVKTKLGTTDMLSLGLSATQRQVEMGWGFFSPRYTRSIFGTIGWAFSNGVPARDAQKAIAGMLFGGAMSFYAFGRAVGLSHDDVVERLNPMSRRFMALPIGDNEYGFGSAYRSTLAFLGGMLVKDNWNLSATDNPISRYLRSRTAPVTGNLIDFIEGEDFLGREVNLGAFIDDPARLKDYFQDRFLPLNLESIIEARGPLEMKVLAGLTETVGGRSFPRSVFTIFQEAQEEVFQEKRALGEKPYVDFDSFEELQESNAPATAVINTDPRVQQAQERLEHESRYRVQTTEAIGFKKLEETRTEQEQLQLEDDAAFNSDELSVSIWKDNFRGRQREFFARRDQIVLDFGLEFGKDRVGVNAAIDAYFSVEGEDYKNLMTGGIDWDRFFEARDETLVDLSSTNLKLVKEYLRRYDTPTVREFRKAQSDLDEYWAVEDLVWSRLRENSEFSPFLTLNDYLSSKIQSLLDSGVSQDEASNTLTRLPVVSRVTSMVARLRNRYRLTHPSADALLGKWYGLSPAKLQGTSTRPGLAGREGR